MASITRSDHKYLNMSASMFYNLHLPLVSFSLMVCWFT
jgi:hypothetical protein